MHLLKSKNSRLQRGFTLIEIMVATVIMVVLVGLVIQITSEVLKVWNRSSGKLAANAQARIAMEIITSDLETAVFRNNGMQWLRAEDDTVDGPGDTITATVAMKLFAPALDRPDDGKGGDICAIAYKLDYANPIDGATTDPTGDFDNRLFILYRLVVAPSDTFNNLMGETSGQDKLPDKDAENWSGDAAGVYDIIGDDGSNYLVSNIVEFKIDFHVEDDGDTATSTLVTGDTIFGGTDSTIGTSAVTPSADEFKKPLSYATIRLTVISDEGAQMLQNISRIPETVDDVITQHGETYTRRVSFLARPL